MWGKHPFWISDNSVIEVRNLGAARDWYKKTFGLREASGEREDDSGDLLWICVFLTMTRLLRWWNEPHHPHRANM
jgi:hypothetical protein